MNFNNKKCVTLSVATLWWKKDNRIGVTEYSTNFNNKILQQNSLCSFTPSISRLLFHICLFSSHFGCWKWPTVTKKIHRSVFMSPQAIPQRSVFYTRSRLLFDGWSIDCNCNCKPKAKRMRLIQNKRIMQLWLSGECFIGPNCHLIFWYCKTFI